MSLFRAHVSKVSLLLALLSWGCGTTEGDEADADGGTTGSGPEVNECAADSYVDATATDDSRTIGVGSPTLGAFTPACLKIKAGQTVTFEGSLSSHPLSPATPIEGNPENPITETLTGTSAEFTFAQAGSFPFYCELHGSASGQGMAGVVYVVP